MFWAWNYGFMRGWLHGRFPLDDGVDKGHAPGSMHRLIRPRIVVFEQRPQHRRQRPRLRIAGDQRLNALAQSSERQVEVALFDRIHG